MSLSPRSPRSADRHMARSTIARSGALSAIAGFALIASSLAVISPAAAADPDLARLGTTTASKSQNDQDGNFPASNATDGKATTRWASGNGPDENVDYTADLTSDLGQVATISSVNILWEAAYAKGYEVQVASVAPDNDASWTTVVTEQASDGGSDDLVLETPVEARYVRLAMLQRVPFTWDPATLHYYGYSVFSLEVHGQFATPVVSFADASGDVDAGQDATVEVSLAGASETEQTIRVTSADGSATAGTDYEAVDKTVTFAPGETSATVTVPTTSTGPLSPAVDFTLALSNPSSGITLGSRTTTTITILPTGDLPSTGETTVIEDFDNGVPTDYSTWAISDEFKPALTTATDAGIPGSATDNAVLVATVGGAPAEGDWFGFTNDRAAENWSGSDGFSFWFLGTGSNKTLGYELKSGGQIFDQTVIDDSTGWRKISVLFSDLRLKNNHASPARFDSSASTGFAVTLSGLGAGAWNFDKFGIFDRVVTLQDFEGEVPLSTSDDPVGFFTWGSERDLATMSVNTLERDGRADNKVLSGSYLIPSGGYAGFSDNLATPQNWSSFRGIRFWWYASQPSNPASPTAGDDIKVEIKDGGPDGEHSELWAATFKDNWGSSTSRWKLVELPFSRFTLGGYQPGNAETKNGTLDLTKAWGFAPTFTPGKATSTPWAIDDVQLYGSPAAAATVSVTATQDVTLVDAGETATVELRVATPSGDPLQSDAVITYAAGDGSAVEGIDFTAFGGSVTFPAGTESGATQSIDIDTLAVSGEAESKSIPIVLTASGVSLPQTAPRVVINAHDLPYLDASKPTAVRVADLLSRMSLAEKAGQMVQAERLGLTSPSQIADLGLGSILSGGGSVPAANTPEGWADMIDGYQRQALSTSLQIPLLYGADAVHGHSNVTDATMFPHNIGLGATRNPALVQRVAEVTAEETKATGVNWAFAPCLCVSRDERWGRTYESFGEDPALVKSFARANTVGLQGSDPSDLSGPFKVLATAKHWAGDGGTAYDPTKVGSGYPIDQGLTTADSLEDFEALFVDPYIPSIEAGVGSIMPSYSGVDLGDGDVRMHENTLLNTTVLKGELGFDGFLISDWEGIDKLPGGTYAQKAVRSVNSGLDMAMAPYNFGAFITSVTDAVGSGDIEQTRVDDAVSRILTQKFALGLFENAMTDRSQLDDFASAEHAAVARDAVAKSQVLLKNDGVLPLDKAASIYLAGSNADDLGNQAGGWTISWQGGSGDTTAGDTIREGIAEVAPDADVTYSRTATEPLAGHDVGIVVVGETPYAEGQGDVGNNGKSLSLSTADRATIDKVCGAMDCVVLVVAGRTQLVTDKLGAIDGLVASFLPGSEGAGVADVLFGDEPFTGRLPLTWPATADQVPINVGDESYEPLYGYGWGERTDAPLARLQGVRTALEPGGARDAVSAIIDAPVWDSEGHVSDAAAALPLIEAAAALLTGTNADLVVTVARDLAQDAITAGDGVEGSVALAADAEHLLLTGDAAGAVELLAQVLATGDVLTEQQLTFPVIAARTYGSAPFTLKATASSGLPVTYTATGACTVSGAKVSLTSAGTCTVTATQAGNDEFAAALPVSRTFSIQTKVLDTFTRSNGSLRGNWDGATRSDYFRVKSNSLDVRRGGVIVYDAKYGTSQEAAVTLKSIDRDNRAQGLVLKAQGTSSSAAGIAVTYDAKSKAVRISTLRGGSRGATAYAGIGATFHSGDVLTARVQSDGSVSVYRNATLLKKVTLGSADRAYFNGKGGKVGISAVKAGDAVLDNFRGGTWKQG